MKSFELRFSAQVTKFSAISETRRLPECLKALLLLSNSAINDKQRIFILAAAVPGDTSLDGMATNDQLLTAVCRICSLAVQNSIN